MNERREASTEYGVPDGCLQQGADHGLALSGQPAAVNSWQRLAHSPRCDIVMMIRLFVSAPLNHSLLGLLGFCLGCLALYSIACGCLLYSMYLLYSALWSTCLHIAVFRPIIPLHIYYAYWSPPRFSPVPPFATIIIAIILRRHRSSSHSSQTEPIPTIASTLATSLVRGSASKTQQHQSEWRRLRLIFRPPFPAGCELYILGAAR